MLWSRNFRSSWRMGKDTNDSVKYCTYPQKRPKKYNLGNSRQAWLTLVPGKIVYHVLLKHISEQMKSVMKKANMDLAKINHVWSTSVPSVMAAFVWSGESSGCHLPQRWQGFWHRLPQHAGIQVQKLQCWTVDGFKNIQVESSEGRG